MSTDMTMSQANVAEVKARLSHYLRRVKEGETVIVCERGVPIAELRPIAQPAPKKRVLRDLYPGWEIPDSFFDPLPDDILDAFEGRAPNNPLREFVEPDS